MARVVSPLLALFLALLPALAPLHALQHLDTETAAQLSQPSTAVEAAATDSGCAVCALLANIAASCPADPSGVAAPLAPRAPEEPPHDAIPNRGARCNAARAPPFSA
jgi:hypothetical protein